MLPKKIRQAGLALTVLLMASSGLPAEKRRNERAATASHGSAASVIAEEVTTYRIGSGDVLHISVWQEPEASVAATIVRPDGKISVPLIHEVQALGLTPSELEKVLSKKYASLIPAADVTVLVTEINSQKVYVIGAVKKEGSIRLLSPITVLQALAEAGGLTDFAKKTKIYVLRTEDRQQVRYPFDYEAVVQGRKPEQNIMVNAGDTVVVPQ